MQKKYKIEICAGDIDSVKAAFEAGADRVELCDNLSEGGTTPSYGMIKAAQKYDIGLQVLIRPRSGDFYYTDEEFQIITEDIEICKNLGVDGVVIGLLTNDGKVDKARTSELVKLSKPMNVTFHRAYDMVQDPIQSLEDIIACGCDRILTSGQANKAEDGISLLQEIVKIAGERIIILPGSGISITNILKFRDETQAKEFHLSGRSVFDGEMMYRKQGISMGGSLETGEFSRKYSDKNKISEIIKTINQ